MTALTPALRGSNCISTGRQTDVNVRNPERLTWLLWYNPPIMIAPFGQRFPFVAALLVAFMTVNGQEQEPLASAVQQLVQDREAAQEYVKLIKQQYDASAPQYVQARKLYITTYSAYAGWVAGVKSAISSDTVKRLAKDKQYKSACEKAKSSAASFVGYVENLPAKPQARAVLPILTSLVDIGGKVADKVLELRKTIKANGADLEAKWRPLREENADYFEKQAKWSSWDDIK